MRLTHLASRVYNTPLLIVPDKARIIEEVFRRYAAGDKAAALDATANEKPIAAAPGAAKPYTLTAGGVALIPVLGTLVQRASGMDALSGLTSYNRIASQINAALADSEVASILLEIDSPGGEVAGLFDLTALIRRAGQQKRIAAIANEQAFSAAYAIAAAAGTLYAPRTAMVGSVGVVMMHVDQSRRDATQGYTYTPIFAGDHKVDFSSHAPLSDNARAAAQAEVDRLYQIFVAHVAAARNLAAQDVIATQAALVNAEQAQSLGLIDRVASFDEALAELTAAPPAMLTTTILRARHNAAPSQPKGASMNDKALDTADAVTAAAAPTPPTAQPMPAAAAPAAPPVNAQEIETNARTAERARLRAILSADATTARPALARTLALETDLPPDAALAVLAAAAAEQPAAAANPFAAAMSAVQNPTVGVAGEDSQESPQTEARRIVALFDASRGGRAA